MRLEFSFFDRNTPELARMLLGQVLVRRLENGQQLRGRIVESEAYHGSDDTACHARAGKTERTGLMFGPAGHAYIYLIYGMYHMLNITACEEGFPGAVLIRALEPLGGYVNLSNVPLRSLSSGPGKLCAAAQISRRLNGENLVESDRLWLESGPSLPDAQVGISARVGIGYATPEFRDMLWRYYVKDCPFVSQIRGPKRRSPDLLPGG